MDTTRGIPLSKWLSEVSESQLQEVIKNYGEERFARQIARAVVAARSHDPIATTRQLAKIVAGCVPTREAGQDPATRTFQALRIFINQELEELEQGLDGALDVLLPGGRIVAISFHSLEDRIVKRFFRLHSSGDELPTRLPVRAHEIPPPKLRIIGRAQRPSETEVRVNPRARSAIMRVAQRCAA
jgi:16S rRNA (cytosine1402-N4)-methyltransferase